MGKSNSKYERRLEKNDDFIKDNLIYPNWMGDMADYIKDVRLVDLRLINTHHSASYSIRNLIFKDISICQDTSIYYQLYGGVRVFDFRPGRFEDGQEIYCGHGPHYGMKLYECFEIIHSFLIKHPEEFVIIKMESSNKFCGVSHELKNDKKLELVQNIHKIFGQMLIGQDEDWFSLAKTTMKEIWDKKKQIMFVSHSFLFNIKKEKKNVNELNTISSNIQKYAKYIWNYNTHYYGRYANSTDKHRMKHHVSNYINSSQQPDQLGYNVLYTCELQLTPQSITSVYKLTTKLHQDEFVQKWFIDMIANDYRLNIVSIDFVFYNPQFVREIIHSNYLIKAKAIPLKCIRHKHSDVSIIDEDIFKIKLHQDNDNGAKSNKQNYIIADIVNNKLCITKLNTKKIKNYYYQLRIVAENFVNIKICYNPKRKNRVDESERRNLFLNVCYNEKTKENELVLSHVAAVFELNFKRSQVYQIIFRDEINKNIFMLIARDKELKIQRIENEDKMYSNGYFKGDELKLKVRTSERNFTNMFYLEK